MGKPKARKPLPQFKSLDESKEFYGKYGELTFWGREGYEYCLYSLDTIDGRKLTLMFYLDGRVKELVY